MTQLANLQLASSSILFEHLCVLGAPFPIRHPACGPGKQQRPMALQPCIHVADLEAAPGFVSAQL